MTDVVDIRNLWSAFRRGGVDTVIHKNLNLRIEEGELLALVGGSGTGKTVLLLSEQGLEAPQRGTVTARLVSRRGADARRGAASRVGMLFQHGALYSAFTVLENIAFPLRELKTLPALPGARCRHGQAANGGAGPGARPQDAVRFVGRHDQAGRPGVGPDH